MFTKFHRLVLLCLLASLLSACAIKQSPLEMIEQQKNIAEVQKHWQQYRTTAEKLEQWRIKGKIAVKVGTKGGHATLRWEKSATEHIEIYGPLGGGRVEIEVDENGARLKDTKGGALEGDSVAALIEQRLGWPLPFDQLPYWLRGLPASDMAKMEWDALGRIVRMNDQGWQVSYPDYQQVSNMAGEQISVPRKIELNALPGTLRVYDKHGEYLGEDFFVRLIIQSWLPKT